MHMFVSFSFCPHPSHACYFTITITLSKLFSLSRLWFVCVCFVRSWAFRQFKMPFTKYSPKNGPKFNGLQLVHLRCTIFLLHNGQIINIQGEYKIYFSIEFHQSAVLKRTQWHCSCNEEKENNNMNESQEVAKASFVDRTNNEKRKTG